MKNNQKGFTVVELLMVFLLIGGVGWFMNLYKLTQCDFEASYKAEVIRGAGVVVPPIGAIVGYLNFGK